MKLYLSILDILWFKQLTFKKSIAGGVIGAGFDITPKIGISARYAIDFQKTDEEGNTSTPAFKNQVFQAGLGFKF